MKRFQISRMIPVVEVLEVKARDVDEAIAMLKVDEARLLSSTEGEPMITNCWEKPTGLNYPEDKPMLEVPEGWYELSQDEIICSGDKWCARDTELENQWLPSGWIGHSTASMLNNRYIRQVSDSAVVPEPAASPSVPQDIQSAS